VERLALDVGAGECSDRRRGGVGLLRGDAAVLDREVGRVAGGVDVGDTPDLAVGRDGDESMLRDGQAADAGSLSSGSATIRPNSIRRAPGYTRAG
jgi:hypothetical protein